ncbi:MAG: 2-hydroxyacid dehydrogenase [Burkholderiaceae bacterium]
MSEQRPRVVLTRRTYPEIMAELASEFDLVENVDDKAWNAAEMAAAMRDADGVLVASGERIDDSLLAQCARLKAVCNIAVGYNNIDVAACTKHGVLATNTPDVLNAAVADHAWALLLAAARRVSESERWLRAGQWKRWRFDMFPGADVSGTTLGILGMGRIGRAIASRGAGFDMSVIYHSRRRLAPELEAGARHVSFDQLLAESDHLVLVVPYTPEVHHIIGAAAFAKMKRSAVLINIARGGVVDDAALIEALKSGEIAAAGLDVYEGEPALNPGLMAVENVVMTPHIASSTRSTRNAMAQLAIENLRAALAGRTPPCLLNPEALANRR